jgi:pimeloyl-ACP methyl ester carboxylesterase
LSRRHLRSSVDDSFRIEDYLRQAKQSDFNLGDLPLLVIGAGKGELPKRFTADDKEAVTKLRQELLQELAGRSTRGRYIHVPDSGHMVQWDQPQVVIDNILALLH